MTSSSKKLVGIMALTLLAACGGSPEGAAGSNENEATAQSNAEARARGTSPGNSAADIRIHRVDGGTTDLCGAQVCFDVISDKDISHISVDAQSCLEAAAAPELTLYQVVGADRREITMSTVLEGRGQSCEGVPQDARKFDSLSSNHYVVCATYAGFATVGTVTVYAKAGTTCTEGTTYVGGCKPCYGGEGGAGGSGGTAGAGGSDNGAGGCSVAADFGCGTAGTGGSDTGTAGAGGAGGAGETAGAGGCPADWNCGEAGMGGSGTGGSDAGAGAGGSDTGSGGSSCTAHPPVENGCPDGVCELPSPCDSGLSYCGGACVDTSSDKNNCGGCDAACAEGYGCYSGQCVYEVK